MSHDPFAAMRPPKPEPAPHEPVVVVPSKPESLLCKMGRHRYIDEFGAKPRGYHLSSGLGAHHPGIDRITCTRCGKREIQQNVVRGY